MDNDALLSIELALWQLDNLSEPIELDTSIMARDAPMRWTAKDTKYGLWIFDAIVGNCLEGTL